MLTVDDVVEVAAVVVPEALVERRPRGRCMLPELAAGSLTLLLRDPAGQQAERVVPEGVDLDGLATARRHDPVVHLGIHPGELIPLGALAEQPISGIDADAEARAAQVVVDDVAQDREQQLERRTVVGRDEVAVERVEEPERRVGRVIEAFLLAFGEHVRDQAVPNVAGEHPEDVAGLGVRPVARVSPSRLIIVSRPQSVNQG